MNFKTAVAVVESSPTRILATSEFGVSLEEIQLGEHVITFPAHVAVFGCIATQNASVGIITAVPGSKSGLLANQVRVLSFSPDTNLAGLPYTLAAFYSVGD